ncbi:MAG TPA: DUF4979 domain-containing protein [Pelobium sp.]|nr:DUF4979 domain-containing protein [Pelobium sp.]
MKIFNKENQIKLCLMFSFLTFALVSCEDSMVEQIATKRILVSQLQIKTTPELPLLVGKDSLLNFTASPDAPTNGELIWKSDNEAVATVTQDGKISAVSVGTAVVSVSSTDGGARSASVTVKVIDHIDFISDITLGVSSHEIFEGETLTVTPTITPANATYKTLKWTSSNPAIAKVSENGVVTGISKGNVVITASATDGSGKSKSANITVKEVIPVTDISITTVASETLAIGETFPVSYNLVPSNATVQSLIWTSNNAAVATVSDAGVVTGIADGQATISVTAKNNSSIKSSITVVVEAGKINDTFNGTSTVWKTATSGSSFVLANGLFNATMAVQSAGPPIKYRGDFQRTGGAILHAGKYPIIAFKFNRPNGTGNVIFDTNNGSYLNGNNKLTTITGKDGIQVHYADLSTGTFGGSAVKLSTTTATTLTTFQLKIADFVLATGDNHYEVYWVKSFKSLTELEAYINK